MYHWFDFLCDELSLFVVLFSLLENLFPSDSNSQMCNYYFLVLYQSFLIQNEKILLFGFSSAATIKYLNY